MSSATFEILRLQERVHQTEEALLAAGEELERGMQEQDALKTKQAVLEAVLVTRDEHIGILEDASLLCPPPAVSLVLQHAAATPPCECAAQSSLSPA
jgi:hypothetical protein